MAMAMALASFDVSAAWTVSGTTDDGNLIPPFSHIFTEANDFDNYTIIDLDGQGKKWQMEYSENSDSYSPCVQGTTGYGPYGPQMNDWLITPGFYLEKDKIYRLTVNMSAQSNYAAERFEVCYGSANTADGMTEKLIEPTSITNTEGKDWDAYITPAETGVYYIGVHGISDCNSWRLYCDYIKISAPSTTDAPSAVTDITITPDTGWELKAELEFTAPATSIAGEPLQGTVDVDVYRSTTLIGTVKGLTAGAKGNFTDDNTAEEALMTKAAEYEYTLIPRNGAGEGYLAKASTYIGPNIPGVVENLTIAETENPGEVTIRWTAPTLDKDGNPVPADKIYYALSLNTSEGEEVLDTHFTGTEYTATACPPSEQVFAFARVIALSSAGQSDGVNSPSIVVGIPDTAPYIESYADAKAGHLTGFETVTSNGYSKPSAMLCIDADYPSVRAADGDDGFAYCRLPETGDKLGFFSGKIDLSGLETPRMRFSVFKFSDSYSNTVDVLMREPGGEYTTIGTVDMATFTGTGWHSATVAVPEGFKNKTIQFELVFTNVNSMNCWFDRVSIAESRDVNLSARAIKVDSREVYPGKPFELSVDIDNMGDRAVTAYTVELYCNGTKVAEQAIDTELAPDATATVTFSQLLGANAKIQNEYIATVLANGDGLESDNSTPVCIINLQMPDYPAVSGLSGKFAEGNTGVTLSWDTPDLSGCETEHTVSDFEAYEDHATDLSPFTTHDGDGEPTSTETDEDIPGITDSPASWFVIDGDAEGNGIGTGYGESGKYVIAACAGEQNDDWLITPELYGGPQVITFYARAYNVWYGNEFLEILTSETDNAVESFETFATVEVDETDWVRYRMPVPDGTKYVAFRYISEDMYFLALDNIEFAAAGSPCLLKVIGYNIYRNNEKLNDEPVAEPTFTDTNCTPGTEYDYEVSVVYNEGESRKSEAVRIAVDSVNDIITPADTAAEYFNLQGVKVADGTVAKPVPALAPGIYLRRTAGSVEKVTVR